MKVRAGHTELWIKSWKKKRRLWKYDQQWIHFNFLFGTSMWLKLDGMI
jgi:hypothetical protein